GEDCDIRIQNHFVSSRHALITTDGREYFVEAFGTNGTFCNTFDLERAKKYRLKPRDEIRIADVEIEVVQASDAGDASRIRDAELMRKVMELEQQLHTLLVQRMDLRSMKLATSDPNQVRGIHRHLDQLLEEHLGALEPTLRDFVVRMTFKRELLAT